MARTRNNALATIRWLALALAVLFVSGGGLLLGPRAAAARSLGQGTIPVLGVQVDLDTRPDIDGLQNTMAAIKGIPTGVRTFVGASEGIEASGLRVGSMVKAELSGPTFGDQSVTVMAPPNQLLELPVFKAAGDHFLRNVRLEDASGVLLLARDPARPAIVIEVLDQLLVTQVTSRPLTLEEIVEKGIVIDEDNFTALNFTVGLTLGSEQVVVDLPVLVPTTSQALAQVAAPSFPRIQVSAQQLREIKIPNFSIVGFGFREPPELEESIRNLIPPIHGVIVIPGNIAFLNQFFSVILQATNTGPEGSGLVLENTSARILLPPGGDDILETGDDPLRVAETQAGGVEEELPLLDATGSDAIAPQRTHQAEFLVEGLREGAHEVTFDLRGDLFVPALGETVELRGRAAGVVQVKNPAFSIVLAHPDVVRAGEEYSLFATVTNTSSSPANLFRLELPARQLSGARLAPGQEIAHELETLLPGDAETFEYRLVAETTGKVTGTVFLADEGVNGSFVLTTGVGDTGIPLSPDSLVLPQTVDHLPDDPDLVFAALRLLGQAYSVATAPAGALPPQIARVSKPFVFDRAVKLAQKGLHARFGEDTEALAQDLLLDYLGNDLARLEQLFPNDPLAQRAWRDDAAAFDGLRRAAAAGENFSAVVAALLSRESAETPLADYQRDQATRFASRPAFLSFGASSRGAPVLLELRDAVGRSLGRTSIADADGREIPFGARLNLSANDAAETRELLMLASPSSSRYELAFAFVEGGGDVDLSLVIPGGQGSLLVTWPSLAVAAGGSGVLRWPSNGEQAFVFEVDVDGDGSVDLALAPSAVEPIVDAPPRIVSVRQWAKGAQPETSPSFALGDPIGRMVGVLFDEEVDRASAERLSLYGVDANGVAAASLQPDRRLVFVVLDRPVGPFVARELRVRGVEDLRRQPMSFAAAAIEPDPERGVGGRFTGQVVTASGEPVPFAPIHYIQPLFQESAFECYPKDFSVASYQSDAAGRFAIDFVLQSGFGASEVCTADVWLDANSTAGTNHFKLEAEDPETGEIGRASTRVQYDGQHLDFRIVIRGTGAVGGFVFDEEGRVFAGGDPGTPESIPVYARNLSTGETHLSWVDANGYYAFPRSFESAGGDAVEAPSVATGNLAIQVIRTSDGATGVTTVNIPGAGAQVEQDIVMFPPYRYGEVSGRVLEADGVTPAANVFVQLAADVLVGVGLGTRETGQRVIASAFSDADGAFVFVDVPAGDIELRALRKQSFEQASAVSFLPESGATDVVLVLPGSGGTVRGLVLDALGNPVPHAKVAGGPATTSADEDGRFEILGLPLGDFTIYGQGFDSLSTGKVKVTTTGPDDLQEIVIRLEPVGSIVGTVFEADGVTPVLAQKVQLWVEPDKGVRAETYSDVNGEFRFEKFPLGRYSVRAIDADRLDGGMTLTDIRFAADVRDADIVFRGLGEVGGRVVQSNGTPVISDVLITRKVWKIITDVGVVDNAALGLAILEQYAQIEGLSDTVQSTIEENRLRANANEFFVLADETAVLSSDILGPGGEVTGRFHFDGLAAAGPFTVAAFGPFLTPAEVRSAIPKTKVASERIVDVGDLVLEPSTGSIEGTVHLPDGVTPVGGGVRVKVRSLGSSGTVLTTFGAQVQPVLPEIVVSTEADGSFHFPLVLRGAFVLTADTGEPDAAIRADRAEEMESEDFAGLNLRLFGQAKGVAQAGDEPARVDIRLEDVAGVRIKVVESDGATPVAGARVRVATASGLDEDPEAAFTDADGEVDFFPVSEGRFSASATLPGDPRRGGAAGEVPINPPNGLEVPITIQLGAVTSASGQVVEAPIFGSVAGQVYKADGSPLVNPARVTVTARGAQVIATTDVDGRFLVEDVPGGFFEVDVFEPFTARRGSVRGTLTQDGGLAEVEVTLVGLGTVLGEVFDSAGVQPLAGVDLVLLPSGDFTDRLVSRTNPDGFYSLPGVPLGPYTVMASDFVSGLGGSASDVMERDGDVNTTDVLLEPSAQIVGVVYGAGVVLDASGNTFDVLGQPLANPPVAAGGSVTIRGAGFSQTVQTDADGGFASSAFLPLGSYALEVRSVGGDDGAFAGATLSYDAEEVFVPVALRGTGRVQGVVVDSIGVGPVAGASVTLASESDFSAGAITHITDAAGRFDFDGVSVGPFAITLHTNLQVPRLGGAAEGEVAFHEALVLFEGEDAIALQAAGSLTARVLLDDGATPAADAIVRVIGEGRQLSRLTDGTGSFRFDGIPLGRYTLTLLEPSSDGVASEAFELAVNGEEIDFGDIVLDGDAPTVLSTDPAAGASGANPGSPVRVTFSEPVDLTTLEAGGFQLLVAGSPVPGRLEASVEGAEVSFIPDVRLPDLTRVSVALRADVIGFEGQVIGVGVRDEAGNSLVADLEFTFTTGDSRPPKLLGLSPKADAQEVDLSSVLRVEFDEPIAPASIQDFVVLADGVPVAGALNAAAIMGGRVIVFTPDVSLQPNRSYTATLAGPVRDRVGNPALQTDIVWSFETIDTLPPVVASLSPAAGSAFTTGASVSLLVELAPESGDTVAVEFYVDGALRATTSTAPFELQLPLTAALGNAAVVGAVARDAAGNRSALVALPIVINANAPPTVAILSPTASTVSQGETVTVVVDASDDLGLATLSFSANGGAVASGVEGVAASTTAQASFSFSIPTTAAVGSTVLVQARATDSGGASSTSATVALTVEDQLAPTLSIGRPSDGAVVSPGEGVAVFVRADDASGIAQLTLSASGALDFAQTRDLAGLPSPGAASFDITVPASAGGGAEILLTARAVDGVGLASERSIVLRVRDGVAPVVTLASATGSSDIDLGGEARVRVTASDAGGVASIGVMGGGGEAQTLDLSPRSNVAQTFSFDVPVQLGVGASFVVEAFATDAGGNRGEAEALVLTTVDRTPPSLVLVSPASGGTVAAGQDLVLTTALSDRVGVASMTCSARGGVVAEVTSLVDPASSEATASCSIPIPASLASGTAISVSLTAFDVAGNASLPETLDVTVADVIPPQVVSITPADGAADVAPDAVVRVEFDEAIDLASFAAGFELIGNEGAVGGSALASDEGRVLTFSPDAPLAASESYAARVGVAINDLEGNALAAPVSSRFTVSADQQAPCIIELEPLDGAEGLALRPLIRARFDEALAPASVTAASAQLLLVTEAGEPFAPVAVDITLSEADPSVTLAPVEPLDLGAEYLVRWSRDITDLGGNRLASPDECAGGAPEPDSTPAAEHRFSSGTVVLTTSLPESRAGRVIEGENLRLDAAADAALGLTSLEYTAHGTSLGSVAVPELGLEIAVPTRVELAGGALVIGALADFTDAPGVPVSPLTLEVLAASGDEDSDGLSSGEEIALGTDPFDPDSDGDGVRDGEDAAPLDPTPAVIAIAPADAELGVSLAAQVTIDFSTPLDPASVTAASVQLTGEGGVVVASEIALSNGESRLTLTPVDPLAPGVAHSIALSTSIRSIGGIALAEPFSSGFVTGDFSLVFPRDGESVAENSELLIEARASAGIGIASVAFSVNGEPVATVGSEPFSVTSRTPRADESASLTLLAIARDAGGGELARDEVTVSVVPAFRFARRLIGVPLAGSAVATLVRTTPALVDLDLTLTPHAPGIIGMPTAPLVFPAGATELALPLSGVAEGATTLIVSSGPAQAGLIVSVHAPQPGREDRVAAVPAGVTVRHVRPVAKVLLFAGATTVVEIPVLDEPATTDATVDIVSDAPGVAEVIGAVTIPEGERSAVFDVTPGAEGSATLTLSAEGSVVQALVVVGTPAGTRAATLALPAAVNVRPVRTLARVRATPGLATSITIPLLALATGSDTPISIVSNDPSVADVLEAVSIPSGAVDVSFEIVAGIEGRATLTLSGAGTAVAVEVVVGPPASGAAPIFAAPAAVRVRPVRPVARVLTHPGESTFVTIPLLAESAGSDTPVSVVSDDPSVADVFEAVSVPSGEREASFEIVPGFEGRATLTLSLEGTAVAVEVVVGGPTGARGPIFAEPVGVEVE